MKEQQRKTPEMIAQDKAIIEQLRAELMKLTDMVPEMVMNGFHATAVQWKVRAIKGRKLAESQYPTRVKLENALTELRPYYQINRSVP